MRTYISLPISGHREDEVREQCEKTKTLLKEMGHEPVSPLDGKLKWDTDWLTCIIQDLKVMGSCNAAIFLEGWENSPGCRIERIVAERTGLEIVEIPTH